MVESYKDNSVRAPRNRTLTLTAQEISALRSRLLTEADLSQHSDFLDKTIHGDLLQILPHLPDEFADLILIDPPYNLTKDFHGMTFNARSEKAYEDCKADQ